MTNVKIQVRESNTSVPVVGAEIFVGKATTPSGKTDEDGVLVLDLTGGTHDLSAKAFQTQSSTLTITVPGQTEAQLTIDLGAFCNAYTEDGTTLIEYLTQGEVAFLKSGFAPPPPAVATTPSQAVATTSSQAPTLDLSYEWTLSGGTILELNAKQYSANVHWDTTGILGPQLATVKITDKATGASLSPFVRINVRAASVLQRADSLPISMRRAAAAATKDLALWVVIRKSAEAMSFSKKSYNDFINLVLCGQPIPDYEPEKTKFDKLRSRRYLPYTDADAYRLLKAATEAFVVVNCAVALDGEGFMLEDVEDLGSRIDMALQPSEMDALWKGYLRSVNGTENRTLPYLALIREKLQDARLKDIVPGFKDDDADLPQDCIGILRGKLTNPCLIELIWSYWHEESMLVQTMNAIGRRFQNIRSPGIPDPLANLEIDPLRPLNNLLWGYIQDEQHRLTVVRRAYEYDHHYGITLYGKAVPELRPADSRSKFLEAFHNLLYLCTVFYKQSDDTTVVPDGFPVLNALKEVHLLLSEGAHNQFGDLTTTARIEMLMQQWLLARPEFREFLPTRIMVAYPEPWMDRVDAMKKLQGWTDVSVLHFHDLAKFGEQILLGIRYGAWNEVDNPVQAGNWARFWRPEVQGYIHAYRAVTGVDLAAEATDSQRAALRAVQPSALLRQRLQGGAPMPALPAAASPAQVPQGFRQRRAVRR